MKKQLLLLLIVGINTAINAGVAFKKYGTGASTKTTRNLARGLGATSVLGGVAGLKNSLLNKNKRALLFGKDAEGKRFYRRLKDRATQKALAQFAGSLAAIGLGSTALYKNWDSMDTAQNKAIGIAWVIVMNKSKYAAAVKIQKAWKAVHLPTGSSPTKSSLLFENSLLSKYSVQSVAYLEELRSAHNPDHKTICRWKKYIDDDAAKIAKNTLLISSLPQEPLEKKPIKYQDDKTIAASIAAYRPLISADLQQREALEQAELLTYILTLNTLSIKPSMIATVYNKLLNTTKKHIALGGFKKIPKLFGHDDRFTEHIRFTYRTFGTLEQLRSLFSQAQNPSTGTDKKLIPSNIPEDFRIDGTGNLREYLKSLIVQAKK